MRNEPGSGAVHGDVWTAKTTTTQHVAKEHEQKHHTHTDSSATGVKIEIHHERVLSVATW